MTDYEVYEKFCSHRFEKLERLTKEVNEIVVNGLRDRMQKVEKFQYWILGSVVLNILIILAVGILLRK